MRKITYILILVLASCSLDEQDLSDPVFCTTEFVAGLEITVKSSATGAIINDNITVIVTDGPYTETLQNNNNTNVYSGAYEREGAYTVSIISSDFLTYSATDIINVESDICHVLTESREITIDPN